MRDSYTIGEIILGTRQEYLKIEELLKKLKALCDCYDKEIKEFYFRADKIDVDNNKLEVRCIFKNKLLTYQNLIRFLKDVLGIEYSFRRNIGYCSKPIKDSSLITALGGPNFTVEVQEEKKQEFEYILESILNLEFLKKMNFRSSIDWADWYEDRKGLHLFPDHLSYIVKSTKTGTNLANGLMYIPKNDIIKVFGDKYVNNEILCDYLNKKVPIEKISDYHKKILASTTKPIILMSLGGGLKKEAYYNVEEDKEQVRLILNRDKNINI